MNIYKLIFTSFFCIFTLHYTISAEVSPENLKIHDIEELLDSVAIETPDNEKEILPIEPIATKLDISDQEKKSYTPINIEKELLNIEKRHIKKKPFAINNRVYQSNPFFIELVFKGYGKNPIKTQDYTKLELSKSWMEDIQPAIFSSVLESQKQEVIIQNLRSSSMRRIASEATYLFAFQEHKLPDVSDLIDFKFSMPPIDRSVERLFSSNKISHQKIAIEKVKYNPWNKKANALLQLSESYVSKNWHQGGTNNTAILGILNANLNYDDKKFLQWENFFEWRAGFNTVDGDTLRLLNTNDDIMRTISKLGIKAGGNWFYSGSVDFSTQLFRSYKAVNSTAMKTNFLTPVRLNVSVGFDYKYKKLFSLMISPLSYKFIYANDTVNIDQKTFGIPDGETILSQVGSSFRAQMSYSPYRELQIDSRLNFFTNYEKVEIDWEIVGNFKINRYLSTRLSLNPRYDNTVLTDDKARLQFKQLLTIGFSYRII